MEKYDLGLNNPRPARMPNPDSSRNIPEKLDVKVEIAKPEDWRALKELRFIAINSKDAKVLGATLKSIKEEENKSEDYWRKEIISDDRFIVLSWNGSEAIGMSRAVQKTKEWWHMGWIYIKKDFRHKGIAKKMTALRLNEIKKRGGSEATVIIETNNEVSIHNCESFGFKKINTMLTKYPMKTKLEIIKNGFVCFKLDLNKQKDNSHFK